MTDPVCSEFATFLYLLMDVSERRFFDDAKRLMKHVKDSSEPGLGRSVRQQRIDELTEYCRDLIRRLEADRVEFRYRIPNAVREMGLSTLDLSAKFILLGNFELAVLRFEQSEKRQPSLSDNPPAA